MGYPFIHLSGSAVGIVDLLNTGAATKIACTYQIHRQLHFPQAGTICKRPGTQRSHAVIQHYFFQIDAVLERILTHEGNLVTDMKASDFIPEVIPRGIGCCVIVIHIAGAGDLHQSAGIDGPFCIVSTVAGGHDGGCQRLIRLDLQLFRIPDGFIVLLIGGKGDTAIIGDHLGIGHPAAVNVCQEGVVTLGQISNGQAVGVGFSHVVAGIHRHRHIGCPGSIRFQSQDSDLEQLVGTLIPAPLLTVERIVKICQFKAGVQNIQFKAQIITV